MKEFKRLLHYVLRYRGRVVAGVLFGLLSAVLNVASLPALQQVFTWLFEKDALETFRRFADRLAVLGEPVRRLATYLVGDRLRALVVIVLVLLVVKVLQCLARGLQEYLTGYVAVKTTIDISNDLYRHVVDLPVGFFSATRVSQTVSRFTNDMANVERGVNTLFGKSIREPLNFVFLVTYCFWKAPVLTGAAMLVMPLVAVVMVLLGRKVRKGARRALASRARLVGLLSESLNGIRIVKAFVGMDYEKRRFGEENKRLFRQNLKIVKAEAATAPLVELLLFLALALMVVVAGYLVLGRHLRASEVPTMFAAFMMAVAPLRKLANVNNRYQLCRTAAERIFEYMDAEAERLAAPGAVDVPKLAHGIRFENVSFSYDESEPVLEGVSFEVAQGEVVAVVGVSGVGKTSLVNLLPRFYEPTAGRILFDGTDIAGASLRSIRAQIGLVTQDVLLFDDTVRANIAYGAGTPDEARVQAAARAAHVQEFVKRMPKGYDTVIGEGGALLSGGQRQRLAIARAIYRDPAILILDEATSSLDSESEHLIKEALEEFMHGRTTFVIAHRLATVERADRIIVLEHGRIEAMGTHGELVDGSGVYRGLYQRQFRDAGPAQDAQSEEETS